MEIDISQSWGDLGSTYIRFAESGEHKACRVMRVDAARAFAGMQALSSIMSTLNDEQSKAVSEALVRELTKMGI